MTAPASFPPVCPLPKIEVQCAYAVDYDRLAHMDHWRPQLAAKKGLDSRRCLRNATFAVAGICYCERHAGTVLLAMALSESKAPLSDRLRALAEALGSGSLTSINAADLAREAADALDARRTPIEPAVRTHPVPSSGVAVGYDPVESDDDAPPSPGPSA